jgi:protein-disulfide isomerase
MARAALLFIPFSALAFLAAGDPPKLSLSDIVPSSSTSVAATPASPDTILLDAIGFYRGDREAPVTIIEFSDFGCPFCAMFARGTYPALAREFVETGRARWILVPFDSGRFRNGGTALRAALCAAEQDRFFEMQERLYASQREWLAVRRPESLFRAHAAEIGLDESRFTTCYSRNQVRDRAGAAKRAVDLLRIRATPTFMIDGQRFEGSLPAGTFRAAILRAEEAVD